MVFESVEKFVSGTQSVVPPIFEGNNVQFNIGPGTFNFIQQLFNCQLLRGCLREFTDEDSIAVEAETYYFFQSESLIVLIEISGHLPSNGIPMTRTHRVIA